MAKQAKGQFTFAQKYFLGLAIVVIAGMESPKPFYGVLAIVWGMSLAFPIERWHSKKGWQFSRLERLLMAGYFLIGLILLIVTKVTHPDLL